MNPLLLGTIAFIVLIILVVCGIHIGPALIFVGLIGTIIASGRFETALAMLVTTPFYTAFDFGLVVAPLYAAMGLFSLYGGFSEEAYKAAYRWLGRLPGGMAIATVWACTAFGAASGSAVAAASIFTKVSLPEMVKYGYEKKFSAGLIAQASALAVLIPPSLLFIVYGVLTEQSIAKLFIAGVIPGIVFASVLSLGIVILVLRNPKLAPPVTSSIPWKQKFASLRGLWGISILALVVLGGIYGGIFTPTESAAVGAFGAFVIAIIQRKLTWGRLWAVLIETAEFTSLLYLILIGALIFSRFLSISGFTNHLVDFLIGLEIPRMGLLAGILLIMLFLGCFLDGIAIMCLTMATIFPLIMKLGFDPIWFGVVLTVALEAGLVTPPFGLGVFTVKAATDLKLSTEDIFRGAFPFLIMVLVILVILIIFPGITLFLPNLMRGSG